MSSKESKLVCLKFGKRKGTIVFEKSEGFDSLDIDRLFQFNYIQTLFALITGLKESTTDRIIEFERDVDLGKYNVMKIPLESFATIDENKEYEIIISDIRQRKDPKDVFTEEELAELKECFEMMDIDGNGVIDLREVKRFFEKIRDIKIEKVYFQKLEKLENCAHWKYEEEIIFKKIKTWLCFHAKKSISTFVENDLNGDTEISFDEFLNNEIHLKERNLIFGSVFQDLKKEDLVKALKDDF